MNDLIRWFLLGAGALFFAGVAVLAFGVWLHWPVQGDEVTRLVAKHALDMASSFAAYGFGCAWMLLGAVRNFRGWRRA